MRRPSTRRGMTVALATERDMNAIFRLRHEVYARELGQHPENVDGRLTDRLDEFNSYIVAKSNGLIAGFISITPPSNGSYSVDKYFCRDEVPTRFDDGLYELRLLTVARTFRGSLAAAVLMYAALRWIEARGGRNIVAIGRVELLDLYVKAGLRPAGRQVTSGAVSFELLTGTIDTARDALDRLGETMASKRSIDQRLNGLDWQLEIPLRASAPAYHGGASFDAIGREFDDLRSIEHVINADVLDAWFPPSPKVTDTLREHLPWAVRTSPPTGCEGLIGWVARSRGVPEESVLPGGGSSNLIFLALRQWLAPSSRVLVLDPTYGEYTHVFENVIGCRVDRLELSRIDGYTVNPRRFAEELMKGYDLAVIVNPNNPTGRHIPRAAMEDLLRGIPPHTIVLVDETYIDYIGKHESIEHFAANSPNVVVCKSMSKVYALSGVRVGYLCGHPRVIERLRPLNPPWAVSLLGQMAAVMALQDPEYYAKRHRETHGLRSQLAADLQDIGEFEIVPGTANYLLCHLPEYGPDAETLMARCREYGLFIRDAGATAPRLGGRSIRIAVKDAETNRRMIGILGEVWRAEGQSA